jgi:ATP-dependent exoDNAse (exonuclease V) alpha subunit
VIESIDEHGIAQIKLDSGRAVRLSLEERPHLDHGYAVTSHSSQGATADRVLINVDSEQAGEQLVNSRLAYVAVSRARYDAQIYTNDAGNLGYVLSREVSHAAAIEGWNHDTEKSNNAGSGDQNQDKSYGQAHGESQGYAMAME